MHAGGIHAEYGVCAHISVAAVLSGTGIFPAFADELAGPPAQSVSRPCAPVTATWKDGSRNADGRVHRAARWRWLAHDPWLRTHVDGGQIVGGAPISWVVAVP